MSFEVLVTARTQRDLDRLPPKVLLAAVEFLFGDLAQSPSRVGKPLQRRLAAWHGARRGPYRVLYRIDEAADRVFVLRIAHRSEVYRED